MAEKIKYGKLLQDEISRVTDLFEKALVGVRENEKTYSEQHSELNPPCMWWMEGASHSGGSICTKLTNAESVGDAYRTILEELNKEEPSFYKVFYNIEFTKLDENQESGSKLKNAVVTRLYPWLEDEIVNKVNTDLKVIIEKKDRKSLYTITHLEDVLKVLGEYAELGHYRVSDSVTEVKTKLSNTEKEIMKKVYG